ncbi:vitamin K epoxide reductase family protein [Candidatus Berkelbacteria bacterium]|nr:vitamin K epoxide reductase family protein [Candidatus Berkelbacteria bacterium]
MKSKLLTVFSVVGALVSVYLTTKAKDPSSVICSLGGSCEIVLSSKYAFIWGVPVSTYGIIWYLAMLALIYLVLISKKLDLLWLKIGAIMGLGFSLYLLAIEIFVLHAYCTWCLVSLVMVLLINYTIFFVKEKK